MGTSFRTVSRRRTGETYGPASGPGRRPLPGGRALVTLVFGVLFLPGMLAWVIAFRIRDALNKSK
ncbi:hypothetical protein ACWD6Z_34295, partial [Streptomyces californicus]